VNTPKNNIMKICSDCKQEKQLNEYSFDKNRNRYLSVCKRCSSLRTQEYRKDNLHKWRQYDKNRHLKIKEAVNKWKSQGCAKCGDKRHYVIDAHHLDPSKKEYAIGDASTGPDKIQLELKKCIPLCSNCHREFHYLDTTIEIYLAE
jgi:hypothetical protein